MSAYFYSYIYSNKNFVMLWSEIGYQVIGGIQEALTVFDNRVRSSEICLAIAMLYISQRDQTFGQQPTKIGKNITW